jgi:hypothetical protein
MLIAVQLKPHGSIGVKALAAAFAMNLGTHAATCERRLISPTTSPAA